MIPWFKTISGWSGHPKVAALAQVLARAGAGAFADAAARGIVASVWDYAATHSQGGTIPRSKLLLCSVLRVGLDQVEEIAAAMLSVGLIELGDDENASTYTIHDWLHVQSSHMRRLSKDNERPNANSRRRENTPEAPLQPRTGSASAPPQPRTGSSRGPRGVCAGPPTTPYGPRAGDEMRVDVATSEQTHISKFGEQESEPRIVTTAECPPVALLQCAPTNANVGGRYPHSDPHREAIGGPFPAKNEFPPGKRLLDGYNAIAKRLGLPHRQSLGKLAPAAAARERDGLADQLEDLEAALAWSDFHLGTAGGWRADFVWLCRPDKATALIEQHKAAVASGTRGNGNGRHGVPQRTPDEQKTIAAAVRAQLAAEAAAEEARLRELESACVGTEERP